MSLPSNYNNFGMLKVHKYRSRQQNPPLPLLTRLVIRQSPFLCLRLHSHTAVLLKIKATQVQ